MTGNPKSFRQGATTFRNTRDWTKEKRNKFIETTNRIRPSNTQLEMLTVDASSSIVSSFAMEASLDEPYTTEYLSQESRTSLNVDSNIIADVQDSASSASFLQLDYSLSAKRRKQSKAVGTSSAGYRQRSAAVAVKAKLSDDGCKHSS